MIRVSVLLLSLFVVMQTASFGLAGVADQAQVSGIQGGLVVHLGCGDGKQTAKLLLNDRRVVKPWPEEIDQWTHYLHGPDNNAVAQDTRVGLPKHVQWIGYPKFARSHEQLTSVSAMVSARGRLFYIIDEGLTPTFACRPDGVWWLGTPSTV